ncbi:MAG: glycosyltransferase [Candidatus Omnitrophota bacterium]|nr:MAG: glycosyltransferase [Candidatus Omnitrophota bacterium]
MKVTKRDITDAFALLAITATLVYIITRTTLFLFAEYKLVEKGFAFLLIMGEFFVLMHGMGYSLSIFQVFKKQKEKQQKDALSKSRLKLEPSVAILVAARHEPKEVMEDTFITINNINYKNKTVYLLDDSTEDRYKRESEELASEYNLVLFRRKGPMHGAKAGVINDWLLEKFPADYITIFDADQNPLPEFLNEIIPILENDKKLAFVQTPQFYTNIAESAVARGAAFQQAVFYEYICESKSLGDSMFCCGTNIVFRRRALEEVGGLDESTVTEDFATSVKLHARRWKSLYYGHTSAFGMGPESLSAYFKQQFRWAAGTIAVFKKLIRQFFTHPFSLTFRQWREYFLSSTYYFIGIAFYILMLCPVIYLLFKIPSFFAQPEIYLLAFLPYIVLSVGIFYIILKKRNYSPKDLFLGQLLGICAFSVYIRAAFAALAGVKTTFGITEKSKVKAISYIRLWPQLAMIFLNLIAIIWGINRFIYEQEVAILVNGFWATYHLFILSSVFYFNRGR